MNNKKPWKDLTAWQKVSGVMLDAIQVSLLIAALADIRQRPAEQIRGRKLWWVIAAFVNYVGPISYFLFGRK